MTQVGSNRYSVQGDRHVVTATFTPLTDEAWDTGLRTVEFVHGVEVGTGAAGDDIAVASIVGGIVTWDVTGTISTALVTAQGV